MVKRNSQQVRNDPQFVADMRRLAQLRLSAGLAKFKPRDMGTAEMTRLLRRTEGYKKSLNEMRTKPRKEDVKR